MRFVGIDVGKAKCHTAIMDQSGSIMDEFTFANDPEGIEGLTSKLNVEDRAVMESTGNVWLKLYECLKEQHVPTMAEDSRPQRHG